MPLPSSVRAAIGRRLDYLPAASVDLLTIGALIGREFSGPLLARVVGSTVEDVLAGLEPALAARGKFCNVPAIRRRRGRPSY